MKYMLAVTVAALLTVLSVRSASAQVSTLTNADVIRFVAMGLSDQAVTTLINEAKGEIAATSELCLSEIEPV